MINMICEVCKIDFDKLRYKNKCSKCYHKKFYIDNIEKISESNKQWRINNKEEIKKLDKIYSLKKKETISKRQHIWYINNKEKVLKQQQQYYIDNHEKKRIKNWKRIGLIELEGVYTYEILYEYYLSINNCEVCNKKFKDSYDRCMDHCHTTGLFRWVLCRNCNNKDHWMTYF